MGLWHKIYDALVPWEVMELKRQNLQPVLPRDDLLPEIYKRLSALEARTSVIENDYEDLEARTSILESRTRVMANDYGNTLHVMAKIEQRFSALCDALGVDVVVDFVHIPPEPTLISTRENGLMGNAAQYLEAVIAAGKLAKGMYKSLEAQLEVLQQIKRK